MSLRFHVKPGEFHSGRDQFNCTCAWDAEPGRGLDSNSLELTAQFSRSWELLQGFEPDSGRREKTLRSPS